MSTNLEKDLSGIGVWLNATEATLAACRERPVVLAFINAASVWCEQRMVALSQWLGRNPGRVQLIVVQVPRFDFEREPKRALKLARRIGISAPVLLDAHWQAWRRFEVTAWPTLVLFGADGQESDRLVGDEGDLERALSQLCAQSPAVPGNVAPELQPEPRLPLRFPQGLAVTPDKLYVADTGHHRVLECNHQGRVLQQFGTGTPDMLDGDRGEAAFNSPRGLVLDREWLYVADTGNHAVRRIHVLSGRVDTLCGSGRAGAPQEGVVAQPHEWALDHPVGLALTGNQLHIALAGCNQVWSYELGSKRLRRCAGAASGLPEVRDGSGLLAAFAQPSALAAVQNTLYTADATGSAVRAIQLRGDVVQTLVGGETWEFGMVDGPRAQARLQYPQAIALGHEAPLLWIADTGSGLLRMLRLGGGDLSTVSLPRRLHGPAALAVTPSAVWIAETDAHGILHYDLASGDLRDVAIEG